MKITKLNSGKKQSTGQKVEIKEFENIKPNNCN